MSAKRRRSRRINKSERVLLKLATPVEIQDIAVTIEVSAHGAKVLARRKMAPDARGTATYIAVGREVPCRIVWQRPAGKDGRMETGIEIYSNTNFWALDLAGSELEPEPVAAPVATPVAAPAGSGSSAALLEAVRGQAAAASLPMDLWCAIVDALEAKGVFTREELIAMLRKIGTSSAD